MRRRGVASNGFLWVLSVFVLPVCLLFADPRVCQKCGYESDDAASVCSHCGVVLPPPEVAPENGPASSDSEGAAKAARHILSGVVVDQEVRMGRQYIATNQTDIAKLFLLNALAMDMIAADKAPARANVIAELLKKCELHGGKVLAKCSACEGTGRRIMRATRFSGEAVNVSVGGMPCPHCGGSGFVRRDGTVGDLKLAMGRAAGRYRVLQQSRRFTEVGGAWVPADIAERLSLRDRVSLRRTLATPCENCLGIAQTECPACSGSGRAKCSNKKCVGGKIAVPSEKHLGRTLEQNRKCGVCGGTGIVPCEKCRGSGAVLCRVCNGSGERPECRRCGGEGLLACRTCGGAGEVKAISCRTCGGDGELVCASCQGDGRKR
jgi:hypothetical protein